MGLVWRILAAIAATNLVVLFIFVGLATLQFESILSGLIRERLDVLATRTAVPFNSVVDLGLPVSSVRNARAVLEAAKQSDPAIEEIAIFNPEGEIVHSTSDRSAAVVPDAVLAAERTQGNDRTFLLDMGRSTVAGIDIGPTGEPAGGLVIVYSNDQARDQTRAMAAKLAFIAGLIMLVTVGVGAMVLRLALREHVRVLDGILAAYGAFERTFWRGSGHKAEQPEDVRGLGFSSGAFWDQLWLSEQVYEEERSEGHHSSDGGRQ